MSEALEDRRPLNERAPTVSVVVPSYNHAEYVAEAVASVLDQSFPDLELIVVDDASTDETADIVAAVADPRVRLFRQNQNRAVAARSFGVRMARGRYVALQNSDDVWRLNKLELQMAALAADPGAVASFTGLEVIDETGAPVSDHPVCRAILTETLTPAAWLRRFFDLGNCLGLMTAVIDRAVLDRVGGFRGSLIQTADFDLWVRLAAAGRFAMVDAPLSKFRVLGTNNLGGPGSKARVAREMSFALERFAQAPLLALYPMIFPDLPDPGSAGGRMAALSLRAVDRHGAIGAEMADRVLAAVLDDERLREEAVAAHGVDFIHAFFARRNGSGVATSDA